jgi:hypothetical protein
METVKEIEKKREAILEEMRSIRSMKRGTINEQYLKVRQKGREEPVLRGPYYVFSRREGQKTVSRRLTSPHQLKQAQADVAAHKKFVKLGQEFEALTERLGELERELGDESQEKKQPKSSWKKTRK